MTPADRRMVVVSAIAVGSAALAAVGVAITSPAIVWVAAIVVVGAALYMAIGGGAL